MCAFGPDNASLAHPAIASAVPAPAPVSSPPRPPRMEHINILAVLAAALSSFLLGGLWYSKALFGQVWAREARISECRVDAQGRHPAIVFILSFLLALVAAFFFARMLPPTNDFLQCARTGAKVGLVFVAASFGINYAFAGNSLKLWLVDAGYHVVQFTLFGVVLGLWR